MAGLDKKNYIFHDLKGETLIKTPGVINGQGFAMWNLQDCNVYILDHTAQVQVDDCINCNIVIGPCKGSVFFRDCTDCSVHVASRQIRTRDVKNMKFAVYCPTQPSIEASTHCSFSCWRVAYPGLTAHFQAAELDPATNTWDKVFDFHAGQELDDGAPHSMIDYDAPLEWVEIPVEGSDSPCENPVARGDGAMYGSTEWQAGAPQLGDSEADMLGDPAFGSIALEVPSAEDTTPFFDDAPQAPAFSPGQGDEAFDLDGGEVEPPNVASPSVAVEEGPTAQARKMVEIRAALDEAAKEEAAKREEEHAAGQSHLDAFHRNRKERIAAARANNRKRQSDMECKPDDGLSVWEKMFLYLDLSAKQFHAKDVSRYQKVLYNAKAKNLAVPSRPNWQG